MTEAGHCVLSDTSLSHSSLDGSCHVMQLQLSSSLLNKLMPLADWLCCPCCPAATRLSLCTPLPPWHSAMAGLWLVLAQGLGATHWLSMTSRYGGNMSSVQSLGSIQSNDVALRRLAQLHPRTPVDPHPSCTRAPCTCTLMHPMHVLWTGR